MGDVAIKQIEIDGVLFNICDSVARLDIENIKNTLNSIEEAITNIQADITDIDSRTTVIEQKVNLDINSTTTYSLRESKLNSAEETPTVNGQICWQYE